MPERSRRFFDAMVSHGWLQGYRDPATVESVLVAMSTRRETSGPVARGWDAFVRAEGLLRELGRDLVHHMELWGKEANHVSLGQDASDMMRGARAKSPSSAQQRQPQQP